MSGSLRLSSSIRQAMLTWSGGVKSMISSYLKDLNEAVISGVVEICGKEEDDRE